MDMNEVLADGRTIGQIIDSIAQDLTCIGLHKTIEDAKEAIIHALSVPVSVVTNK